MGRHRMLLSKWQPVLASLEALITKVAALESLLEGALSVLLCLLHRPIWPCCEHSLGRLVAGR